MIMQKVKDKIKDLGIRKGISMLNSNPEKNIPRLMK